MTPDIDASPRARLARLEHYLVEDPGNALLLADAVEAALAAGDVPGGLRHVRAAQAHGFDPPMWVWRQARLCIAGGDLARAGRLLDEARSCLPAQSALDHDRAWVHFRCAEYESCQTLLAPWLDGRALVAAGAAEALQVLWIRAGHHAQSVNRTATWVREQHAAGRLEPRAQGAASLLLLDADDFDGARALADAALVADPRQPEALVARASVALADRQTSRAEDLLQEALVQNREDGRTWSVLAFSSLQAQDLPKAQVRFERALRFLPEHIGTWHGLGWTRFLRRDETGAADAFHAALLLDASFAESHGALGLVLARVDPKMAEHHLRTADRLDPGNVTGRFARAVLRGEVRDRAQLQQLARRLLDRPGWMGRRLAHEVDAALPPA